MSTRDEIDEIHRQITAAVGEVRAELTHEIGWSDNSEVVENLALRAVAIETSGLWAALKVLADRFERES